MRRLVAFACLLAILAGCGKKPTANTDADTPDGGNPPGGTNPPPRALGTGGGTAKVPADGIARIRLHNGGARYIFGGTGDEGHVGALLTIHKPGTFEKPTEQLDVYRVRTGEKVASIPIAEPLSRDAALSPGGKFVASGVPSKANTLRVLAANGSEVGRMSPAAVGTDGRPDWKTEVQYYTFLTDDRLLTVNCSGGYDVWAVPGLKRLGGRPGLNLQGDQALFRMSDNYPNLSALSADGKTIALYNWSGVSLIDLATGTEKVRTEAVMKPDERKPQILRVALSPDAKRIVVLVIPSEGHADKCRVQQYDAADGKLLKETGFARDPATRVGEPGTFMWGPNHLVIGSPGQSHAVLHLPTGNILNPVDVAVAAPGRASRVEAPSFAGRLWYVGYGGGPDHPGYLFGVLPSALPAAPNAKKQWAIPVKLGSDG